MLCELFYRIAPITQNPLFSINIGNATSTGPSITITIIIGFSILALSNFRPSIYFGLLTGAAMLGALLGALLLLPQLLVLFKPFGAGVASAEGRPKPAVERG